jgi:hypothetical protein
MLQSLNIILWLRLTSGLDKEEVQTIKEKSLIGMLACRADITEEKNMKKKENKRLVDIVLHLISVLFSTHLNM